MAIVKRVLELIAVGALLGAIAGTFWARTFIPWYETPGELSKSTQQLCNMPELVRGTIDKVVKDQLVGAGAGAVLLLVAGGLIMRARSKRRVPAPPQPPVPRAA